MRNADMITAEIITIGTEIILGQIIDKNSPYIARKLSEKGIQVLFQTSVGDDKELLKSALRIARDRANLIITTGGLGPTANDITREAVSEFFDIPLVPDKEAYVRIQKILGYQHTNKQDEYSKQVTVHPHLNLPHPFGFAQDRQGGGIQGDNEHSPPLVGGVRGGGELLCLYLQNHHIIAMDYLIVQLIPQHLGNMRGTAPFNLLYLFRRIVRQTPGKNCSILSFTDRNNVAFTKCSLHRYNTRCKQAFP